MQTESLRGLTSAEVAERVATGRANDVSSAPTRTVTQIVRANLLTRFNALLGAMLVVILVVGQFRDALFGLVLIANTLIGVVQELRAKRTLHRLSVLTAPKAASFARTPRRRSPLRRWFWTTSSSSPQETRSSWTARCSSPRG